MSRFRGEYPAEWPQTKQRVKEEADWRCVRCGHDHDRVSWHILTVHHLDGDKSNLAWWNLPALCQRCHLSIQAKVVMDRPWLLPHSEWFKPYAGGYFAQKYLGVMLTRAQVMERLDDYVTLEVRRLTE